MLTSRVTLVMAAHHAAERLETEARRLPEGAPRRWCEREAAYMRDLAKEYEVRS